MFHLDLVHRTKAKESMKIDDQVKTEKKKAASVRGQPEWGSLCLCSQI